MFLQFPLDKNFDMLCVHTWTQGMPYTSLQKHLEGMQKMEANARHRLTFTS